jgi:hypothetical protein
VAIVSLGWWGGWHFGSGRWQAKYERLQAENWEGQAKAERVARTALQDQLEAQNETLAHNAQVMNELDQKRAAIDADRDRISAQLRRVLAQAARSCPSGGAVPETDHRPGAPQTGGDEGAERLARLAGAAIAECRGNNARLDAVVEQITPQL